MLKIVACFKWVVDDADIRVDAGSHKLNLDRAAYKISAYDRNAIEEAVILQEKHGGSVVAMTVAQPGAKPCLKDSLSRGKLEDGVEIVSAPLPALVVVLPDINSPRIPTLRQVLGAAKKPFRMSSHRTRAASRAHDS